MRFEEMLPYLRNKTYKARRWGVDHKWAPGVYLFLPGFINKSNLYISDENGYLSVWLPSSNDLVANDWEIEKISHDVPKLDCADSFFQKNTLNKYSACVFLLGERFTQEYWDYLEKINLLEIVTNCAPKVKVLNASKNFATNAVLVDENYDVRNEYKSSIRKMAKAGKTLGSDESNNMPKPAPGFVGDSKFGSESGSESSSESSSEETLLEEASKELERFMLMSIGQLVVGPQDCKDLILSLKAYFKN